jgi:hypothetical protein
MKIAPSKSQRLPDITPVFAHAIHSDAGGDDGYSYRVRGRDAKRLHPAHPALIFGRLLLTWQCMNSGFFDQAKN